MENRNAGVNGDFKVLGLSTSKYSFRDNKLIITTLGIEVKYKYKIRSNQLTLTDSNGNITIYLK